jgi:phosphonate transport system substrate-binding protein
MLTRALIPATFILIASAVLGGCPKPARQTQAPSGTAATNSAAKPQAPAADSTLGTAANPLVMAFVPSTEAEKVLNSGDELTLLLSQRTGLQFKKALVASSYEAMVSAMGVNKVHVAWLPPMAYLFAKQRYGAQVALKVVRHGKPTYRGQIVVLAESPMKTIADLKGKRVACVEQSSASGYLYPRALLLQNGVNPETDLKNLSFSGSHDSALLALLKGTADAACTFDDARVKLSTSAVPDIMKKTRVLAYTPDIPADNVSYSTGVSPEMAQKITAGLLAIAQDEQGKKILMELYEIEGLVPAVDADYDPVRKMAEVLNLNLEEQVKQGR